MAPPKPGIIPLRRLGLGEMMDGAFQACRRNPIATFGSALLIQGVMTVVSLALLGNFFSVLDGLSFSDDDPAFSARQAELMSLMGNALAVTAVLSLLSTVAMLMLQGALIIPITRAIFNLRTGMRQMWRIARGRIMTLLGLGLIFLAIILVSIGLFAAFVALMFAAFGESLSGFILLGFLVFVVIGTWIGTKLILAPSAVVLENAGAFSALGRSWKLTHRNWWRTFGILLLTTLIVTTVTSIVTMPLSMLLGIMSATGLVQQDTASGALGASMPLFIGSTLISTVFTSIGFAFQSGVTSLLYLDLRIRREGFDIVLLKDLETTSPADPDALPGRGPAHRMQPSGNYGPGQSPIWGPGTPFNQGR